MPIKLTRQQIYDEAWKLSVSGVAKKYNIKYSLLLQLCKDHNIPTPPSGYLTKLQFGKSVEIIPLPDADENELEIPLLSEEVTKHSMAKATARTEPTVQEKTAEALKPDAKHTNKSREKSEPVSAENRRLLPFVSVEDEKAIVQMAHKVTDKEYTNDILPKLTKRKAKEIIAYMISEESFERVQRLLNILYTRLEALGCKINNDLSIVVLGETLDVEVQEYKSQILHQITKEEAEEFLKYQDEVKHGHWATKPRIRKYDEVYNGRLQLNIYTTSFRESGKGRRLESRMDEIVIAVFNAAEKHRTDRLAREKAEKEAEERRKEEQRKAEEERKRKDEWLKKYNNEIAKTNALLNEIQDFVLAGNIRAYANAILQKEDITPELSDYASWMLQKADWIDPSVSKEDELLGKRPHSKDASFKQLEKKYSYYW